jgi:hypothetical protein
MLDVTAMARVCDSFDQLSGDLGLAIGTVATVHRHFVGEVFPTADRPSAITRRLGRLGGTDVLPTRLPNSALPQAFPAMLRFGGDPREPAPKRR